MLDAVDLSINTVILPLRELIVLWERDTSALA